MKHTFGHITDRGGNSWMNWLLMPLLLLCLSACSSADDNNAATGQTEDTSKTKLYIYVYAPQESQSSRAYDGDVDPITNESSVYSLQIWAFGHDSHNLLGYYASSQPSTLSTANPYELIQMTIDETYAEFADDLAGITAIPLCEKYDNLIVLRGTSKFFACPGIRLGYAICGNAELREAMRSSQNPWSLNSLADLAGQSMMTDTEYQKKTWELIDSERRRMTAVLRAWESVKVYPARANFIFMRILREDVTAGDLFVHCIKKGLMIRDCSTFPFLGDRYVRFCVMLPADNDRLLDAMAEVLDP